MQPSYQQSLSRGMLSIVDGALAGIMFVVPLLLGGRHPLGQLVLVGLALAMGLAWAGYLWCCDAPRWRPNGAMPLLLAAAALLLLQCTPLPPAILSWLAPEHAKLLPSWSGTDSSGAGLGVWRHLSMTPAETRAGLAIFLAYAIVFVVLSQRLSTIEDVERILRWSALAAIGMAVFGLAQFLGSNGKYFWFYEHFQCTTSDAVKGSFTNRNHFAQFLALGVGPLVWWLQHELHRKRQGAWTPYLLCLALGIVLFAGLMSLSRGGIIAITLATMVVTIVCYRLASLGKRFLGVMVGAVLLIGASLAIFGYERVARRLDSVSSGSLEELDRGAGRRFIWAATLSSIPHHLIFGSGIGSFAEVYPAYASAGLNEEYEFTHSECGYLQVPLEAGAIGFLLLISGIGLCGWWCFRGLAGNAPTRLRLCAGAAAAGLAASVAHSAVDFIWYVPACTVMAVILAACILRVRQLTQTNCRGPTSQPVSAVAVMIAGMMTIVIGILAVDTLLGPAKAASVWNHYRIAADLINMRTPSNGEASVPRGHPRQLEDEERLVADLQQTVALQPTHGRAHLALAEAYLRLFDRFQAVSVNPMSLLNVRDAVVQSDFPTRQAMTEWLSRAIGEHWHYLEQASYHARKALTLCPLQGQAYVYLAELCFLDPAPRPSSAAYIDQALRVRPFDGTVLYGAGSEAYVAGDSEKWLEYIQKAFHGSRRHRQQLIEDLIGHTSSENIPTMIDFIVRELQPDLAGLRLLYGTCQKRCPAEKLIPLARYWAQVAECEAAKQEETKAASCWLEASNLHTTLQDFPRALQCAECAKQCDPNSYAAHYQLALCQLKQGQFAEAESNLHWCRGRKPNDRNLEIKLREALKGRLDAQLRSASDGELRATR